MKKKLKSLLISSVLIFSVMAGITSFDVPVFENVVSVYADGKDSNYIINPTIDENGNMGDIDGLKAESGKEKSIYNTILKQIRIAVVFISGVGTLLMVAFFVLNFITLGKSQGNPQERQKAISGLIMTGLATAGLGSVFLVTTLFYNMLGSEEGVNSSGESGSTGAFIEQVEIKA
jgi:hypothetical protein